jgi:hypothetical protein
LQSIRFFFSQLLQFCRLFTSLFNNSRSEAILSFSAFNCFNHCGEADFGTSKILFIPSIMTEQLEITPTLTPRFSMSGFLSAALLDSGAKTASNDTPTPRHNYL